MGLLNDTAAMARGRLAAIVFTAALPLVPACLVAGGIMRIAASPGDSLGAETRGEAFVERSRDLPPDAQAEKKRDLLQQAREPGRAPGPPRPKGVSLRLALGGLLAALVVLAGVFLAQAALLHVAAGCRGTAVPWSSLAARFPAVLATTVAAVALVAIGLAACVLPGVVTALMVSVAAPVAVVEGRSGFSAVQRSWWLMKRAWPPQLGLLLSGAVPLLLLSQGLGRMLPDRALPHALLDAGLTVVLLPLPTFASVVLYLRQRASTEGKSVYDLCQYILRISAPG
jgi:hypothetical protein